jgi:uncharacterized membrane protein (UPF0127 family)
MKTRFALASLLALTSLFSNAQEMPRLELTVGMYRIEAEVAAEPGNRAQGLMNRRSMAPQQGMLFVFRDEIQHCMWMRNTYIPLSVAFLDREGRIINIEDMQPQTENNHCAARPARYALEMNRGWFAAKGIKPGTRLAGIEKAPAPR